MAENADFWKGPGPTIFWKTGKTVTGIKRTSSVFSLLGATWQLEMEVAKYFREMLFYRLHLRRTGNIKPQTQISVITSVLSSKSMKDSETNRYRGVCFKTNVIEDATILWFYYKSDCYITGFDDDPYVTVICLFTSMSGILNETGELTTQTDSDRSLVKSLHDLTLSSDANLDSLSRDLCKLLDDKVAPDINLRCGDRTVAAHKLILAARSPVFSAMFQSKMSESETGVVDITDIDAQVLEIFLKYVYSGRLSDLCDEDLPSLYAAGDKYDVSALKSTCSERMVGNLTRENCLNILKLANAHGDKNFEKTILEFILNQADILKSEEWTEFRKENLSLSNEVYDFVVQRKLF